MKKIRNLVEPYLCVVFGALLFLVYLNYLQQGMAPEGLAIGIVAVILSAYYLCAGIIGVVLGSKISKTLRNVFDIVSISAFPIFKFVEFLLVVVQLSTVMGPTAWVISILSLVASIALPVVYLISRFANNEVINHISYLFAIIFVLVLLLNMLFDVMGSPIAVGDINIVGLVIYLIYSYMLMNSLMEKNEERKAQDASEENCLIEEQVEEKKEESLKPEDYVE